MHVARSQISDAVRPSLPCLGTKRSTKVAVKSPKRNTHRIDRDQMLREAAVAAQFDHANIIALLGVVTRNHRCDLVFELCDRGSLHHVLRGEAFHPGMDFIPEIPASKSQVIPSLPFFKTGPKIVT